MMFHYQNVGVAILPFSSTLCPLSFCLLICPSFPLSLSLSFDFGVSSVLGATSLFQFHPIVEVNYVEPDKDGGRPEEVAALGQLPRSTLCCSIPFCFLSSDHSPSSLLSSPLLYSLAVTPSVPFLSSSAVIFPAAPVVEESEEIKARGSWGDLGKPTARRRSTGLLERAVIISVTC